MTTLDLERRRQRVRSLLEDMRMYYITTGEAMPMKIVSAKHYKALESVGGFHTIINELIDEGRFQKFMIQSGRTFLKPAPGRIGPKNPD